MNGERRAATPRSRLWRAVFTLNGGLSVEGAFPPGGFVLVANHCSHADAPALLAALGARPVVVAAAADYWFQRAWRARICSALVGAFPVRRGGGGSADLARAAELLRAGTVVVIFPEGTRSRNGSLGGFHRGAARLAAQAGVPLVPVGIAGTRAVLPPHGRPHRGRIEVRVGVPVAPSPDVAALREQVAALAAG